MHSKDTLVQVEVEYVSSYLIRDRNEFEGGGDVERDT